MGQCVAAAVIALTLTVTGAAGYAAAVFEPQTALLVEPGVVDQEEEKFPALAAKQSVLQPLPEAASAQGQTEQQEQPEVPAQTEVPAQQPAAGTEQPAAEQAETPVPEQPAQPEAPQPAAPTEMPAALPQAGLDEENGMGDAVWQQMTPELAAEDPLAARYEAITPDANGSITLTPDQFSAMLENQSIDWDEENCLTWLFDWLFGWLFPQREAPAYTGWHTEGGKTYYYDAATHQPLTGLQTIDDKIYYFDADGVRQDNVTFGIDVSRYQQNVDWNKVKDAGASFAIIRIGYRGYGSGALVLDSMFENHFAGARAAGLKVGVYIFSQAINEDEAREEAFACAYVLNGRSLDYPVYFDSEYSTSSHTGRADNLSKAERTACAVAFCEELKKYGYEPGVYASTSWFQNHLELSALQGYRIWNAHYGVSAPSIDCDMWQGSCTGKLSGVSSSGVDLNISYMG